MEITLENLTKRNHRTGNADPEIQNREKRRIQTFLDKAGYERRNPEIYDTLLNYFSKEQSKGLALLGEKGIGKSYGLECFSVHKQIKFVTAAELSEAYAKGGYGEMERLAYPCYLGIHPERPLDLMIDEIGSEPSPSYHFGSPLNVVEEVLRRRYILWDRYGAKTIFSSNLPLKSSRQGIVTIETLYGDYIADRVSQMCEIPRCRGKNLREVSQ